MVLIEEISGSVVPLSITINRALFWVQIHNVPLHCMTKLIGEAIASQLGECIMVDSDEEGFCFGKFMWVQVNMDICRPLRWGIRIALATQDPFWVEFQHENYLISVSLVVSLASPKEIAH